jgi:DNA-binding transcriptional regulator YdaS (Cro superfamily)
MREELKDFIQKSSFTQRQIAVLLGVKEWKLSRWLTGATKISELEAEAIRKRLKMK